MYECIRMFTSKNWKTYYAGNEISSYEYSLLHMDDQKNFRANNTYRPSRSSGSSTSSDSYSSGFSGSDFGSSSWGSDSGDSGSSFSGGDSGGGGGGSDW